MDEFRKELDDYFCRFTFGQFVTLILLEIVTLFMVFYLGARYGPDLIGESRSIATERGSSLPKEGPSSVDEIVGTPPVDYTYPEILTGAAGDKAIKVKPSGLTSEEFEKQKRATPVAVNKEEKPAEKTKEQPKGKFSIQVGSYQSVEEANSVVSRWKEKGYSTFLSIGQIPEKGTWYRVRIGGFPTREEAETFLDKFKTKEGIAGLVVLSSS